MIMSYEYVFTPPQFRDNSSYIDLLPRITLHVYLSAIILRSKIQLTFFYFLTRS